MKHLLTIAILMAACGGANTSPAPAAPDFVSVGFGSGGSGCTITGAASTFRVGVPIHVVLELSPSLPTGGTVTFRVEKDGVELVEGRQTFTATEPTACLERTLSNVEVGHYRFTYAIRPSRMPPVSGEFDVTP